MVVRVGGGTRIGKVFVPVGLLETVDDRSRWYYYLYCGEALIGEVFVSVVLFVIMWLFVLVRNSYR